MRGTILILTTCLIVALVTPDKAVATEEAVVRDCSTGNINVTTCLQLFPELGVSVNISVYTAEQLDGICKNKDETNNCLIREGCDESSQLTEWEGVKDAFTYLCTDGKEGVVASGACWQDAAVQGKMTQCGTENNEANKKPDADSCNLAKVWIQCLNASTDTCTSEATNVLVKFAEKRIKPLAKKSNCEIGAGEGDDKNEASTKPSGQARRGDDNGNNSAVTSFSVASMMACYVVAALLSKPSKLNV